MLDLTPRPRARAFGTRRAAELWRHIKSEFYENVEFAPYMRIASMAMCSSEEGWDDYTLLYHFDLSVKLGAETDL